MKTSCCYSDTEKLGPELESVETSDIAEVVRHLDALTKPKRSLRTKPGALETV
jgi:hypothetical protein